MKKLLLALLLASASLSSCKKDNDPVATPAPSLEGRWQQDTERHVTVEANGTQSSDQTTTYPSNARSLVFTATEFIIYAGTTENKRSAYTRVGNVIRNPSPTADPNETVTIEELTADHLVIKDVIISTAHTITSTLTYHR
jgi:hypothetical protein